eukprot:301252-Chlamydomonas_euryale.AAC.2
MGAHGHTWAHMGAHGHTWAHMGVGGARAGDFHRMPAAAHRSVSALSIHPHSPSINLSFLSSFYPSIYPHPSIHSSVRPSVHPSVRPSVHPSVRPSVRPSVHPIGSWAFAEHLAPRA